MSEADAYLIGQMAHVLINDEAVNNDNEVVAMCVQLLVFGKHRDFHSVLSYLKALRFSSGATTQVGGVEEAGMTALSSFGVLDPKSKLLGHLLTKLDKSSEDVRDCWHKACYLLLSDAVRSHHKHMKEMDEEPDNDQHGPIEALKYWIVCQEKPPPKEPTQETPEVTVVDERVAEPNDGARQSVCRIGYTPTAADKARTGMSGSDVKQRPEDRRKLRRDLDVTESLCLDWGNETESQSLRDKGPGLDMRTVNEPSVYVDTDWAGHSTRLWQGSGTTTYVRLPKLPLQQRLKMLIKPSEPAVGPYAEANSVDPSHAHRIPAPVPVTSFASRPRRGKRAPLFQPVDEQEETPEGRPVSPEYPLSWLHSQEHLDPDTRPFSLLAPGKFFRAAQALGPPPSPHIAPAVKLPPLSWAIQ
jgi:hypothetical protein